jgi:hypothetical protein
VDELVIVSRHRKFVDDVLRDRSPRRQADFLADMAGQVATLIGPVVIDFPTL